MQTHILDPFSFAQILGYITFLFMVLAYLQKDDRRLFTLSAIGIGIWIVHTFLLGAWTTSGTSVLNLIRILSARLFKKEGKQIIFYILVPFYFIVTYFTYQQLNDLLPLGSGILASYSMLFLSSIPLRRGMIAASFLLLINNFFIGSIGGVATEIFNSFAHCFTIIRLRRDSETIMPIVID